MFALAATIQVVPGSTPSDSHPAVTRTPAVACSHDRALDAFVGRLKAVVARRDSAAVLRLLSPGIVNSFGGDGGVAEFKRAWQLDKGRTSPLWRQLERLIAAGCSVHQKTAAMPASYLRGPAKAAPPKGYRLLIDGVDGKWQITALVAGD